MADHGKSQAESASVTAIKGRWVTLRPAVPADARPVYEWLVASDLTGAMMGPPLFPEVPLPSWDEFRRDYAPHFFDGSKPRRGRSFIIELNGEAIGHINYDGMDPDARRTELDIWLRASRFCGKGFGSDAIAALVSHLAGEYGVEEFVLRPSARNPRAIRAYMRAGFRRVEMSLEEQTRRYGRGDNTDDVLLVRRVSQAG